ncbi:DUF5103 domain-containing protein [Myroides odoratimimus]|uniref:type IX secretion system plug protein n=1 Tax=Myroides odoratimimus TaxID=76832 RepID=UPI00103E4620|nr:DUF5103 domain-containing protein [Myroides odoratimimus]MCA4792551.1 DUF5103 domain-containing protein [Myroides odoratimimus]MCA4805250.1 DUF5103 domain-containing protein [Myroides odoratimimus]MCA4819813.1 DUF5103 domain-containing protein [Myroides odoratimimus]MDM1058941.1 DUF5103 domain-containing protein [Myroides odoratimimus]MDM1094522.1 DUF5103 domain-containing protein [Myroides odoratimimus]
MRNKVWSIILFFLWVGCVLAQSPQNYTADYIKSVGFMSNNRAVTPFFQIGDRFTLVFDDLYGDDSNYFYRVKAYNYDWTPSKLKQIEYIDGLDRQRIMTYENSFNTLQNYTNYQLTLPAQRYRILKSGNYVLEIYNEDDEVVIRRKFVLYESLVNVPIQIKRTRNLDVIETKQNVEFSVLLGDALYQNPVQNIKIAIFQNGRWDSYLTNIKPQYTMGNDLIYKYENETQFWAGNQFLNFDNSDIKQVNNMIGSVTTDNGIYNTYLYTNESRKSKGYTYFPDINGSFYPRNINGRNPNIEAEYSWVYFSYCPEEDVQKGIDYYVTGLFNDYALVPANKMTYNEEKGYYEQIILVKQGFTNFSYTAVRNGVVDPSIAPDGNYAMTTNRYQVLVYYRGNNDLHDRVIGIGEASAENIVY